MNPVHNALNAIESLLRKYGYAAHADLAAKCRDEVGSEGTVHGWKVFDSLDWWGGAGSIADINLYAIGGEPTSEIEDNRRLRAALIALYEQMLEHGIKCDRADQWISVFRKWQQKGL